ncbi:MAG TPA: hypothetical protein VJP07_01185 [Dehalococcoidia bacterium]|nr:hypothetical protein [Dehalococcoidia bacterium]
MSIDVGSIAVDAALSPGGRYRLPTLTVRNIGDDEGDYEVAIVHLNGAEEADAPAPWFEVEPDRFHLSPDGAQQVQVHLVLPTGADPGRYSALIEAHSVSDAEGVRISAAAASRVSFEVKPSSTWAAWLLQFRRSFADHYPWSHLALFTFMTVIVGYLLRRFIRLRIGIERRR